MTLKVEYIYIKVYTTSTHCDPNVRFCCAFTTFKTYQSINFLMCCQITVRIHVWYF